MNNSLVSGAQLAMNPLSQFFSIGSEPVLPFSKYCRWYFPPPLVWGYYKLSAMRIASHPFSKWDQMDQSIPRHVKSTSSRKSRHFQQYKGNYRPNHAKVRSFWVISPVPRLNPSLLQLLILLVIFGKSISIAQVFIIHHLPKLVLCG